MKKYKLFILIVGLIIFGILIFFSNKFFTNGIKGLGENEEKSAFDESADFYENNSNIIDIAAGNTYTAILKEDGSVWVSGKNETYTSNHIYEGIKIDEFTKMKIENIKQIGVGSDFVIALKENGDVYSWGGNSYSELGIEGLKTSKPYQVPRKVNIKNIEKIYVFGNQVAALSKEGIAYYWGYAVDSYNNVVHKFVKDADVPYEDEKFSYIAISREKIDNSGARILRHPNISSGFIKVKLCNNGNIEEKTITKKEKDLFKRVKKLKCGDLI